MISNKSVNITKCKSTDRQYNGLKKKEEKTNSDSTKHHTEEKRYSNTDHTGGELRNERIGSSCSTNATRSATVKRQEQHIII